MQVRALTSEECRQMVARFLRPDNLEVRIYRHVDPFQTAFGFGLSVASSLLYPLC